MSKNWMKGSESFEVHDAREQEPGAFFPLITGLGDALAEAQGLRVIQSFEPVPLYAVMESKGLEHETVSVSAEEFHVYFYRPATEADDHEMTAKMRSHLAVDPTRVVAIEAVVQAFYDGEDPESLKARFDSELGSITGTEFAFVEQKMTERGVSDNEFEEHVEGLLDIFRQALDQETDARFDKGHPLDTMARENTELLALAAEISERAKQESPDSVDAGWWDTALSRLWQVDRHYVRKENELFPRLEQKGFDKPSTVMWSLHDKVRDGIKGVRAALANSDHRLMLDRLPPALDELVGMTYKEAKILFPTCESMLSFEEWVEVRKGDDEIGYCLIEQPAAWPPLESGQRLSKQQLVGASTTELGPSTTTPTPPTQDPSRTAKPFTTPDQPASRVGTISLGGGALTPTQIAMVLQHLPLDLVFVDEYDEVVFTKGNLSGEMSVLAAETIANFKDGSVNASGNWEVGATGTWSNASAVRDQDGKYCGYLQTHQILTGS